MNEHPYWTTLTVGVGLIAAAAAVGLLCLARWAWHKGSTARDRRNYQRELHQLLLAPADEDLETEHRLLITKHQEGDQR